MRVLVSHASVNDEIASNLRKRTDGRGNLAADDTDCVEASVLDYFPTIQAIPDTCGS